MLANPLISMAQSPKSVVGPSLKPMNVFYVWYVELCRRANSNPSSTVKAAKPKNETVLDFVVDRIKLEEWTPIVNALSLDTSLHVIALKSRIHLNFGADVNTEEKVRKLKRTSGVIGTDYVLKSLLRSLGCCLLNNPVLSTLELEGLNLEDDYFKLLLESLKQNNTVKYLSLKRCPIRDQGCQELCDILKSRINIQVINLSSCKLSAISGECIANVIKYQQLNRCCETWHKSLRYADPDIKLMAGLKRLTLNCNPEIGDEGLAHILKELDDDLWISALDMQKCNITETMADRIIELVENSRSLKLVDFRNNELSFPTIRAIFEILERKFGSNTELDWCTTTTTLYDYFENSEVSFPESQSAIVLQKTKSAPANKMETTDDPKSLRKTKTVAMMNDSKDDKKQIVRFKKQLWDLNFKLSKEVSKRKQTEKVNNELQQKLKSISNCEQLGVTHNNSAKRTQTHHNLAPKEEFTSIKETLTKKVIKYNKINKTSTYKAEQKMSFAPENSNVSTMKSKGEFDDQSNARNLFEKFLKTEIKVSDNKYDMDGGVENLLTYCYTDDDNFDDYLSDKPLTSSRSNDSLEDFFEELKSSLEVNNRNISQNATQKENFQKVAVKMR